ncbi:MAG TPA: hypothetical protein VHO03_05470 [Ignavibacteriales bacterium]|nr:hypothetical protein [Ignavibacteriales bacterium]
MKIKFLLPVLFAALALMSLSCSDDEELVFDNPSDPFSSVYDPGAPDSLKAAAVSDSCIRLSWKPTSLMEQGFRIFRRVGLYGDYKKIAQVPSRTTTFLDAFPVKTGMTYYYQVASLMDNKMANFSKEASVFVEFLPPSLDLKSIVSNNATIVWNNPSVLTTHFILERSVNGGQFVQLADLKSDVLSYTDSGLDKNNSYSYRIKAASQNNESEYSEKLTLSYTLTDLKKVQSVDLGNPVHSIVFSPDGTRLAASGMSYSLRVWNVSDGALIWDLGYKGPNVTSAGYPFQLAFSHDGRLLAADTDPNVSHAIIKIWRMSDGSQAGLIPNTEVEAIHSICFSYDDSKIMAGNWNGEVKTWNTADTRFIGKTDICGYVGSVSFLYAARDGSKIVTGIRGNYSFLNRGLQLWQPDTWRNLANFNGFESEYYAVSSDEKYFAYNGRVVSISTGEIVADLPGYSYGQESFSIDGQILLGRFYTGGLTATFISDKNVTVSKPVPLQYNFNYPAIAASPKGDLFAITGEKSGTIEFWQIVKGWRKVL